MLKPQYLADLIRVTLAGTPFAYPERALPLLLGTAAQESKLTYLRQLGNGPARGLFQMEPATERDHWRWLDTQPHLCLAITERSGVQEASAMHLECNLPYQILMARVHYYRRDPAALPEAHDLAEQARRWKRYYNTPLGRGTEQQYIESYRRVIGSYV